MEFLTVILASLFSAAVLFIIAKIIGHKQVAQLEFFDYITGITIGSIAAELATTLDKPWWKPTVSMIVFGIITVVLSVLTRKFPRSRKFINGTPTIILNDGKLFRKNMKKAKLELSEFLLLCRQEGYFNLDDIQTAVYEYNGKLSILPVSTKRPLNPEDIALSPERLRLSISAQRSLWTEESSATTSSAKVSTKRGCKRSSRNRATRTPKRFSSVSAATKISSPSTLLRIKPTKQLASAVDVLLDLLKGHAVFFGYVGGVADYLRRSNTKSFCLF